VRREPRYRRGPKNARAPAFLIGTTPPTLLFIA
jgi:hypothetical protein